MQATPLDLRYDPDRSQEVRYRGQRGDYADFCGGDSAIRGEGGEQDGTGVYFLSETVTSPMLAAQWKQVQAKLSAAAFVQWFW